VTSLAVLFQCRSAAHTAEGIEACSRGQVPSAVVAQQQCRLRWRTTRGLELRHSQLQEAASAAAAQQWCGAACMLPSFRWGRRGLDHRAESSGSTCWVAPDDTCCGLLTLLPCLACLLLRGVRAMLASQRSR
jgi:hypothetical protein